MVIRVYIYGYYIAKQRFLRRHVCCPNGHQNIQHNILIFFDSDVKFLTKGMMPCRFVATKDGLCA